MDHFTRNAKIVLTIDTIFPNPEKLQISLQLKILSGFTEIDVSHITTVPTCHVNSYHSHRTTLITSRLDNIADGRRIVTDVTVASH